MTWDIDGLPPTQYLIMDVLAARYRTGETSWTFPTSVGNALYLLVDKELIRIRNGVVERTYIVTLTDTGKAALFDGVEYTAPIEAQLAASRRAVDAYRLVLTDLGVSSAMFE